MSKSGGATWLVNLVPVAYAVAAAMIAAGAYLIDPAVIDLGFGLKAEHTAFVGAFLVAAGALLGFSHASAGVSTGSTIVDFILRYVIGLIALLTFGLIELAIGIEALFAEPPNLVAALLFIPGLLSLAFAFPRDLWTAEKSPANKAVDRTTPDSGKLNVGASAQLIIVYALFYAVGMFAVLMWIPIAFSLYERLNGTLFSGETLDLASAVASLSAVATDAAPRTAAVSVALAVIVAVISIVSPTMQWFSRWGACGANRDLSDTEISFIQESSDRVRAYVEEQRYDRSKWKVHAFSLVTVVGTIVAGGWIALSAMNALSAPTLGSSFPIELKPGGASMLVVTFVAMLLGGAPAAILSRLWRRYSEGAGWVALTEHRGFQTLEGKLTSLVRVGRLSPSSAFRPGDFLHAANTSTEVYFFVPAAALTVFALFLLHRDLNAIDTVTADRIEIVDYWTLEPHRFNYADVKKVVIRCFLTNKGETVEAYELHLRSGRTLDIYEAKNIEPKIAAYEAVDAKLMAMRVPFEPGAHAGLFKGDERGYDEMCVNRVAESFPDAMAERVRKLFHLEQLRIVDAIWPWDRELANATEAAHTYDVGKAVALYTKAIEAKRLPPHLLAVAYHGRGAAREDYEVAYGIRDEEMLLALRDFQKAREIEPTWQTYNREAWAFIALGAYEEAAAAYRKALELDQPKPHWPLIGLARVERIQGRYDAAMQYLDRVLALWGQDNATMPIYYHRAWVSSLKGADPKVVDAITRGLEYQPDYAEAFRIRACAYARLGNLANALKDIQHAVKLAEPKSSKDPWQKTPFAKSYHEDLAADLARIKKIATGDSTPEDRGQLCTDRWNVGDSPRARSPLLD